MAERLVRMPLWTTATAIATTGSIESAVVDVRRFSGLDSLVFLVASASGTADVKLEVAISSDGVTFTDYSDIDDLIQSTATEFAGSPDTTHAVSLPPTLGPYVKFKFTGVNANPADTELASAFLWGRESE